MFFDCNCISFIFRKKFSKMANTLFNKVEGKITYVSPISSFSYRNGAPGYVQHFILTDVIKKMDIENGNNEKVLNFKIVIWNELVSQNLLKLDSFYIISNFNIKETELSRRSSDISPFEVHLKKNSLLEEVSYINYFV